MFSHKEKRDVLHPSVPREETALPQSSLYFFFLLPTRKISGMRAFGGDVCNKALIVSDRCEIGIESVPRTPVSAPALGAANTPQPSRNPTAASQRLNNLRLKTHTHNINQMRMYQPSVSSLGRCLQTVCAHQTWPLWLIGNIYYYFFL